MKVKDPVQRSLIGGMAKKFKVTENQLLYQLIEQGFAFSVVGHQSFREREKAFKGFDEMYDKHPTAKQMNQEIFLNWKAGENAPENWNPNRAERRRNK